MDKFLLQISAAARYDFISIFILGDDDFIIQIPYAYMGIFWHIIVKICRYTIFQARFSTYQAYIKKAHPKDLI